MSYDNFVQRTSFSSEQRNVTYEVTPEKMVCIEKIAISLGAKLSDDSKDTHHHFYVYGKNSEHILQAIEMAWSSIDNYIDDSSSLVVISGKKATVILSSTKNNVIINTLYLMASISGVEVNDNVMRVDKSLYKIVEDFIKSQKD